MILDRSRIRAMGESAAWLVGRRQRIRIAGDSMLPTLTAGQFVLLDRKRAPEVGELAVAHHPKQPDLLIVKRVESITDDGLVVLASDNPAAGTDSRTWGPVPPETIKGTVTLVLDDLSNPL